MSSALHPRIQCENPMCPFVHRNRLNYLCGKFSQPFFHIKRSTDWFIHSLYTTQLPAKIYSWWHFSPRMICAPTNQHEDFPLEMLLSCSVNLNLFERVEIYTSLLLQSKVEPRVCLEHSSRICNQCKQIRFSIRFYFMEIFGRWIWNFKKTASKIKVAVIFFGIFLFMKMSSNKTESEQL